MARPAEVADADIIAAGGRVLASGPKARVTGYSLRKMLESGDPARLEAVWKAHVQAQTPEAPDPAPVTPLPPALQEQRDSAIAQMSEVAGRLFTAAWMTADEIAQRRVADEQAVAREKVADAEERLADADDVIRTADARAAEQSARAEGLEQQLSAAKDEVLRAQEKYVALDALRQDLTRRLEEADAEASRAREDAAAARATADAAKADAQRERDRIARLDKEVDGLRAANAALSAQAAVSDAQVTTLSADLVRERESTKKLSDGIEELKTAQSEFATRLAVAQAHATDLEAHLVRERTARASAETRLADALDRVSRAEERATVGGPHVRTDAGEVIRTNG